MPFQTFNRPAQGGKRPGAGRSIKEQAAQKRLEFGGRLEDIFAAKWANANFVTLILSIREARTLRGRRRRRRLILLGGFASSFESPEHRLRVERLASDADAGGVEDGVRNGRGSGSRRGLPGAARRNKLAVRGLAIRVDQKGVDLRNVPDVDGRIGQPVDRGHALGVKSYSLVKCPTHGLH